MKIVSKSLPNEWDFELWLRIDPEIIMVRHDPSAAAVVKEEVAPLGYVLDHFKPIRAERIGKYWRYFVPTIRVTA